ncbi:hypothetical protein [Nonomuraea dietziae]|uniref:hypothetical protein n=1 Tax=Nonomuraea dietziae TaxID=65515 RepID=UPI00343A9DA7
MDLHLEFLRDRAEGGRQPLGTARRARRWGDLEGDGHLAAPRRGDLLLGGRHQRDACKESSEKRARTRDSTRRRFATRAVPSLRDHILPAMLEAQLDQPARNSFEAAFAF